MFWTILALSMTVLMGGIIAYNGDLIGRKYGKRRVSLFNLRPKHTAILITSVTGVFISAVTTGVMFLLVKPVREIILEGENAIKVKGQLERKNETLGKNIEQKQQELAVLQQKELNAEKTADRAVKDQQKAVARWNEARGKLASVQVKLDASNRAKDSAERQTAELRTERDALRPQIQHLRQSVALLTPRVNILSRQVAQKQKENQQMLAENDRLGREDIRLTREIAKLETDVLQRNKALDGLRTQGDDLTMQVGNLTVQVDGLKGQRDSLLQQKTELEKQKTELEKGYLTDRTDMLNRFQALRTKRIAVHGGEDLGRIVIPARARPDSVRKIITQLTDEANKAAEAKGARPDDTGIRAVQVVDKQVMLETPYGGLRQVSVTETDRVNALVHKLSLVESPVCLLAIAVANSAEGEPAAIDFQPFNDWLVYPKGRMIASKRFSGREGPDKLFPNIMAFLKDVGQTAIQRGVIPRIDPMTGNPEVGSLNWTQLVQLVDRVRRHPGDVQIVAYAKDDTKASDPLNLDFDVKGSL